MQADLIIATPGSGATTQYISSLLATIHELNKRGIGWLWLQNYSSHVGDAREITISGTRQNNPKETRPLSGKIKYNKILWIDSDIGFTPEDVIKVYESNFDVVSGAYLLADGSVAAWKTLFGNSYTKNEIVNMANPIKVFATGMGFFCMKSGILEKMSRPWFQSVLATDIVDNDEMTFPIMGEDFSLCKRINDLGHEIWLDPSVRLDHQKTYKITWNGLAL